MLTGKNSISATIALEGSHDIAKTIKLYTCDVDDSRMKSFRDSLKSFLMKLDEIDELKKIYAETLQELDSLAMHHQLVRAEIHDTLCAKLAIIGYNEFKHKIHIDVDGKVYVIDKEIPIGVKDCE